MARTRRRGLSIGWRLFWGVVGGGLTFAVLSVSFELELPVIAAISAAAAVAVAIVGPVLLEALASV